VKYEYEMKQSAYNALAEVLSERILTLQFTLADEVARNFWNK